MKKVLIAVLGFLCLMGCANDNKITIVNNAQEEIMFNFRATETDVPAGVTRDIPNIPNGTFEYATTYVLPPGTTSSSTAGNAGGGNLTFDLNQTHQRLIYASTFVAGTYTLNVNATSSSSTSSTSTTSP